MKINIRKVNKNAIIPTKGSGGAAAYDLYACLDEECIDIGPESSVFISTGIAFAIPEGYWGGIYARSGLACKQGLRPANCVGVVDADYRGEVIVCLYNDSHEVKTIYNGDRIAQLIIAPCMDCEFAEVDDLDKTDREAGGFGSTGIN